MSRARVALTTAAIAAACAAWPAAAPQSGTMTTPVPATVTSITRAALPRGDRLTIELSREVTYQVSRAGDPDRLLCDVASTVVPFPTVTRAQALTGTWISALRVGQQSETSMRLVLQLSGAPRHSVFALYSPFRLVIDLERSPGAPEIATTPTARPASTMPDVIVQPPPVAPMVSFPAANASAGAAPAADSEARTPALTPPAASSNVPLKGSHPVTLALPAPPASTAKGDYSLSRQLGLGLSRIVIDPGHGGHDPGAQGNGIDEANLVLDVALRLETLLKAHGTFDVVMTRRTDEFIPLEQRTAIANREGADLFLSIHANAAHDVLVSGIETYFLNFATNPAAEALAARENATSAKTMGNLPDIVKAITLNNKIEESKEFASLVQTSMLQDLKAPQRSVKDLGVKQAPFVVLIGAQMPSVLAEISFLTNKSDAAQMRTPAFRQTVAQALYDAVVKYRGSLKRTATGPAKTGAIH
jgi:N-acetylmuramoyl-L-alanine amidase